MKGISRAHRQLHNGGMKATVVQEMLRRTGAYATDARAMLSWVDRRFGRWDTWYHLRIWSDLPLEIDPRAGAWLNAQLEAMARAGRGSLPAVNWNDPPRYAIPLWIEGEKFFFWALVYGLALFYPFARRAARPFRTALYLGLLVYLAGVVFSAKPFTAAWYLKCSFAP